MKKKKTFRSSLSFDASPRMSLGIEMAGISMPMNNAPVMETEVDLFKTAFKLGWFGSSNDMNTFYPGVNVPKDVIPKPEDFIDVPFRLLSATIVGAGTWKATDFTDVQVLKGSRNKLLEKTVYIDHETETLNWVGLVKGIKWTEAFTNADGIRVPAGIDGTLAIDAKSNPKVARGLLMGSIYSNSVTVIFDWTPSHTFENMYEFENRIGQRHDDGSMIRRVVTEIHDYYETSLVWLGADPFAKLIDKDGNLKNIDASSISYSKEDEKVKSAYEQQKKFAVKYGLDKNVLVLSKRIDNLKINTDKPMDKILAQLAALLGVEAKDLTVDSLSRLALIDPTVQALNTANAAIVAAINPVLVAFAADQKLPGPITDHAAFFKTHGIIAVDALTKLKEDADKYPAVQTQNEALTKEVETLKKTDATLQANAKAGEKFISMKRAETVRLYTVHVGGTEKADAAVIKLINETGEDALEGLLKQYVKDTTGKFSGACKKCGSDEFEFRSSVGGQDGNETTIDESSVSRDTIYNKFAKSSINMTGIKKD